MKKFKIAAAIALALIAAIVAFMYFRPAPQAPAPTDKKSQLKAEVRKVIAGRQGAKATEPKKGKKKRTMLPEAYQKYSADDRKLSLAVQDALDEEDFAGVQQAAELALKSDNPDVRRDAVDALAWFGADALPELTVLMSDPDEEVAEAALGGWEQGLAQIDESSNRVRLAFLAMSALSDANQLDTIGTHFSGAATEYIDEPEDDKTQNQRRVEVVQSLAEMILEGNANASTTGKELYEEITGNKWISLEEAEKYVADPDKYEEPDDDD